MTIVYPVDPNFGGRPIIIARIECLLSGKTFLFPMLLDTGADETCFPGDSAAFFGHDNDHPKVKKGSCGGIGGHSDKYIHSVQVSLLEPVKMSATNPVIAWTARYKTASFIKKLNAQFGLIGMDIMREWKSVKFSPNGKGLKIEIVI
ncbi:MAG TPA: hypothetical protein VGN23_08440 [Verrucomicrobiae bacterium]